MTYGGYGSGPSDPFGSDPFGGPPSGQGFPPPGAQGFPTGPNQHGGHGYSPQVPPPQGGEVNTLSTLSIVFAFLFAPAGAVLGHVALHQIRQRGQRGRERALIGLTLSYVIIVLAIIALVVWLLWGGESEPSAIATPTTTTTATTTTRPAPPPPPRTTVFTPPPTERPTVQIEDLRVGDCVEVVQQEPNNERPNTNFIEVYRTPCQVRDGVEQVDRIASNRDACPGYALYNNPETVFACVSDFKG